MLLILDIKLKINYVFKYVLGKLLFVFFIFRVRNKRIIFESFNGEQISCNPYYLYMYIRNKYPCFELIWSVDDKNLCLFTPEIKYVKHNSLMYFYYLMTSKVFITNNLVPYFVPFRGSQIIINTWHGGGAYKKVGNQFKGNDLQRNIVSNIAKKTKFFLSSSKVFTEIMSLSMGLNKDNFLNFGMPRNDIFFNKKTIDECNVRVRKYYGIDLESFVVLYAPTFRKNTKNPYFDFSLDIRLVTNAVKDKFHCSKVVIIFRGHHLFSKVNLSLNNDLIINVSDYPLMQELLCASNMLISDYSSCIWDYSLLFRPCFLFVPDLKEYINERDFYFPIFNWGFPVAQCNSELGDLIRSFSEQYFFKSMLKHQQDLGSFEQGNATIRMVNFIVNNMFN